MAKWQYKFHVFDLESNVDTPLEETEKELDQLGEEGWEVISVLSKMGKGQSYGIALLKRAKS